jgi:hypothetical protein
VYVCVSVCLSVCVSVCNPPAVMQASCGIQSTNIIYIYYIYILYIYYIYTQVRFGNGSLEECVTTCIPRYSQDVQNFQGLTMFSGKRLSSAIVPMFCCTYPVPKKKKHKTFREIVDSKSRKLNLMKLKYSNHISNSVMVIESAVDISRYYQELQIQVLLTCTLPQPIWTSRRGLVTFTVEMVLCFGARWSRGPLVLAKWICMDLLQKQG